jgi:hypothetical protein
VARGQLLEQLRLRNRVLEELLANVRQMPPGQYPTTLDAYRTWESGELGIEPIGSKSSVSPMSMKKKGRLDIVNELAAGEVLWKRCKALRAGRPGGKRKSKTALLESLKLDLAQATRERDAIASRYHEICAMLESSKNEVVNEKQKSESLQRRLNEQLRKLNDGDKRPKLVTDVNRPAAPDGAS